MQDGETVLYGSASELRETLDYDLLQRMPGILEMRWLELTITILLKEYMKLQNSWSYF